MKYGSPLELFQWNCWSVRIFSRSKWFLGIWIAGECFPSLCSWIFIWNCWSPYSYFWVCTQKCYRML